MSYRAQVDGCYLAWSPTLHEAYRYFYPKPRFTLAKIGGSGDVFARLDSLNGLDTYFSEVSKAIPPSGYAHVKDWQPWRLRQERVNLDRLQLERTLQDGKAQLRPEDWKSVFRRISDRFYVPKVQEIYIVDIDRIQRLLPVLLHDVVPQLRDIDRRLNENFGDGPF